MNAAGLNALALSVVNFMIGLSLWVPVLPTITEKVKFAAPIDGVYFSGFFCGSTLNCPPCPLDCFSVVALGVGVYILDHESR
jgi:hypothetical protein